MKKSRIVAALLCASMGLAVTASFAQPAPYPDHGYDNHGAPGQYHDDHGPDMNHHMPPPPPPTHHADWHKGARLDNEYRDRQYVVDNWHEHGLRQPPRGYQWVGVGGDYLLVAAATGVIADVILSR